MQQLANPSMHLHLQHHAIVLTLSFTVELENRAAFQLLRLLIVFVSDHCLRFILAHYIRNLHHRQRWINCLKRLLSSSATTCIFFIRSRNHLTSHLRILDPSQQIYIHKISICHFFLSSLERMLETLLFGIQELMGFSSFLPLIWFPFLVCDDPFFSKP